MLKKVCIMLDGSLEASEPSIAIYDDYTIYIPAYLIIHADLRAKILGMENTIKKYLMWARSKDKNELDKYGFIKHADKPLHEGFERISKGDYSYPIFIGGNNWKAIEQGKVKLEWIEELNHLFEDILPDHWFKNF